MKFKHFAASLAVLFAIAASALMLPGLFKHEQAPAVSYTLLGGQAASSAQWQGKVVLVNFWATSCVTCLKEMPELMATHEKFKARGFETVAVAMSYDNPAYVARFTEQRRLSFQVTHDFTGQFAQQFGDVQLTPTTFLINKRGQIVKRYLGEPNFAALHLRLEKLLTEI
jgi:peroxiredoxin